jgi:hypothetical protein
MTPNRKKGKGKAANKEGLSAESHQKERGDSSPLLLIAALPPVDR